jgi:hypothetical protein
MQKIKTTMPNPIPYNNPANILRKILSFLCLNNLIGNEFSAKIEFVNSDKVIDYTDH